MPPHPMFEHNNGAESPPLPLDRGRASEGEREKIDFDLVEFRGDLQVGPDLTKTKGKQRRRKNEGKMVISYHQDEKDVWAFMMVFCSPSPSR